VGWKSSEEKSLHAGYCLLTGGLCQEQPGEDEVDEAAAAAGSFLSAIAGQNFVQIVMQKSS
jgi:hypothetical protein